MKKNKTQYLFGKETGKHIMKKLKEDIRGSKYSQKNHSKCDCKEKSCKQDCKKKHTHKGFYCEKCEPLFCEEIKKECKHHFSTGTSPENIVCKNCGKKEEISSFGVIGIYDEEKIRKEQEEMLEEGTCIGSPMYGPSKKEEWEEEYCKKFGLCEGNCKYNGCKAERNFIKKQKQLSYNEALERVEREIRKYIEENEEWFVTEILQILNNIKEE